MSRSFMKKNLLRWKMLLHSYYDCFSQPSLPLCHSIRSRYSLAIQWNHTLHHSNIYIYIYIYICCQTVTTYLLGFMIFAFVLSFPCCMSPKPVRKLAPILYDTKLCQMNNYKLTLNKINVGELVVDLSLRKAIVGCKCICKIKTRSDGLLRIIKTSTYSERFKSWVYDINYEETFALLLILLPHYEVLAGCCCCQIVSIISYGCQELMSSSKGIFQNNCIYPSSSRHDHLLEKVYHFIELYIYIWSQTRFPRLIWEIPLYHESFWIRFKHMLPLLCVDHITITRDNFQHHKT